MSAEHALVLVAGYQDLEPARRDFDALAEQVRNKQVALRGAVLVAKDADGNATVIDTGNHLWAQGRRLPLRGSSSRCPASDPTSRRILAGYRRGVLHRIGACAKGFGPHQREPAPAETLQSPTSAGVLPGRAVQDPRRRALQAVL
jgi:hypothetical protein